MQELQPFKVTSRGEMMQMNNMQEEAFEGKKVEASLWIKVFKMIGENKKHLYLLSMFMIMQAAIDVVFPLMNSYALNSMIS